MPFSGFTAGKGIFLLLICFLFYSEINVFKLPIHISYKFVCINETVHIPYGWIYRKEEVD